MFVFVIYGIGDVMISVLALIVLDRGFEPLADQTKDYKIGICCFSAKHATLKESEQRRAVSESG